MALKRKRSESDISSASCIFSSPLASSIVPFDPFQSTRFPVSKPSLFPSRTRKRHRDNRPSENEVHQHTLSLLYSAQKNNVSHSEPPSAFQTQEPVSSIPASNHPRQQSSLHAFWAIPSQRHASPLSTTSTASYETSNAPSANALLQATNCEDCNALLVQNSDSDTMDVDMMTDIDMDMNGGNLACTSCGKHVCHACAVSNLGADRRCLNCAGRKQTGAQHVGWWEQD